MLNNITLYYYSPTGGTKKAGEILCKGLAKEIKYVDLAEKGDRIETTDSEVAVIAAPVFGGRIPAFATEKIGQIEGEGKKAVTVAVYGTRAYEDALLELNNKTKDSGFEIVASAALIAEHSMVRAVGAGRPDEMDSKEISDFAAKVYEKLGSGTMTEIDVPGNFPYKDHMEVKATPICLDDCTLCGVCEKICPTGAISMKEEGVETTLEKCNLCLACSAHCPAKCRVLPPPMQEGINGRLEPLKDIRRENEFFL